MPRKRHLEVATPLARPLPTVILVALLWSCLQLPSVADAEQQPETCRSLRDGSLKQLLRECVDNSWVAQLEPDTEQAKYRPNKRARAVKSGHYVLVSPTPLPEPYLVGCSIEMMLELGLKPELCKSRAFVRYFSGDVNVFDELKPSWATPYALSIYGTEQEPGRGASTSGYGDGRAISLAEVVTHDRRWELQLKGSGTTPFCRGADGRAVLRSSVREFLASEAMYHLGVPTTRALSLVASSSERVARPWYSKSEADEKHGGDIMQEEFCAMTTRVSPSFLRVGHFELFGRRAKQGDKDGKRQLELLVRHALFRDFPHLINPQRTLQEQMLAMASEVAQRFANLSAEWIRVGYTQSNFNGDNCLVSGRTIDYGPFGFVEKYDPSWGMWIHAGDHFSFMNQPAAAGQNFRMFAQSLRPLLDQAGKDELRAVLSSYEREASEALSRMWAQKLGLKSQATATELWSRLDKWMQAQAVDYTMFWRQLIDVAAAGSSKSIAAADLAEPLQLAFYETMRQDSRNHQLLMQWLEDWLLALDEEGRDREEVLAQMRRASPKFIPREWMLVEAYSDAESGNHSTMHILQELFKHPYEEQPAFASRFYSKSPEGAEKQGGLGFMS